MNFSSNPLNTCHNIFLCIFGKKIWQHFMDKNFRGYEIHHVKIVCFRYLMPHSKLFWYLFWFWYNVYVFVRVCVIFKWVCTCIHSCIPINISIIWVTYGVLLSQLNTTKCRPYYIILNYTYIYWDILYTAWDASHKKERVVQRRCSDYIASCN